MQDIFLKILSMGITASWMIAAVLLLRVLFRKAPKWIICFLWILAGFRLVCPFTIESTISLIPPEITIPFVHENYAAITTGKGVNYMYTDAQPPVESNEKLPNDTTPSKVNNKTGSTKTIPDAVTNGTYTENSIINSLTILWIIGMLTMVSYLIGSYIHIRKKVYTATYLYENIWESEFVDSPFILGLIRPRIYIPYHMDERQLTYILAHERTHIKRKDHIFKVIAFIILSVYWFHPLVWISYILLCRDIELACDEKVISEMDTQEKKGYLFTLLSCSTGKLESHVYPLAFGEIGIKERVIRVKKFKKPSLLLTAIALLAGIIISACLLTNPKEQKAEGNTSSLADTKANDNSNNLTDTKTNGNSDNPTVPKANGNSDNPTDVDTNDTNTQADTKNSSDTLEIRQVSVDLDEMTGPDGPMLYYVDGQKIIFGGSFGLFVYDKTTYKITESLDLKYIECNMTQGDNYCAIAASKDGKRVYLNPKGKGRLYTLDLSSHTLKVEDYEKPSIWKDKALDLFSVKDVKKVSYLDGDTKRTCILKEGGTIGTTTYMDTAEGEKGSYTLLFSPEN